MSCFRSLKPRRHIGASGHSLIEGNSSEPPGVFRVVAISLEWVLCKSRVRPYVEVAGGRRCGFA
jgi:hypothetical protein